MSEIKRFEDMSEADKATVTAQIEKIATKQAADEIQFLKDFGLTEEQIKQGIMTFQEFSKKHFTEPRHAFYKAPIARKSFILGLFTQKGTAASWSSYSKQK